VTTADDDFDDFPRQLFLVNFARPESWRIVELNGIYRLLSA